MLMWWEKNIYTFRKKGAISHTEGSAKNCTVAQGHQTGRIINICERFSHHKFSACKLRMLRCFTPNWNIYIYSGNALHSLLTWL